MGVGRLRVRVRKEGAGLWAGSNGCRWRCMAGRGLWAVGDGSDPQNLLQPALSPGSEQSPCDVGWAIKRVAGEQRRRQGSSPANPLRRRQGRRVGGGTGVT